ncbi:MAG: hypothetical protein UR94_C0002G0027 [Parcubacteria group bacterium GW2011_GWA2_36_10]|nr:MAG: hypothetical protein UR94_C0002G0027 [Parcubacteria group bacterium GW2011_GWA2_36_10]
MKKSEITNKEIFGAIQEVAEAISVLASDVDARFNQVDGRLDKLEQGQNNIFLRLDRVVYRSELRPAVKEIMAEQA